MVDRPATECEVDEDEIEVTPEMIEAALSYLFSFDREKDIPEETAKSLCRELISQYRVHIGLS